MYSVFKIHCIFYTHSTSQSDCPHFKCFIATWLVAVVLDSPGLGWFIYIYKFENRCIRVSAVVHI